MQPDEKIKVLLVEDDIAWQDTIKERSLDSKLIVTETATSKTDALRIIVSGQVFKVLICDTNLAGRLGNIDGIGVAEKFRELHPSSTIIGMSASPLHSSHWIDKCDQYIGKMDEDFCQTIRNACDKALLRDG